MRKLEAQIKEVFIERGIMLENWRLKVKVTGGQAYSDCREAIVEVLKPRCRKPCVTWVLNINIVREVINFDKSYFY